MAGCDRQKRKIQFRKLKRIAMDHAINYKGRQLIVDDEGLTLLNSCEWYWGENRNGKFYLAKNAPTANGKQTTVKFHRQILKDLDLTGLHADHINTNTQDNRRSNLRAATRAENQRNRSMPRNNTSGFKGVIFDKRNSRFTAQIGLHGTKYLGSFTTALEASQAYQDAALKLHGKFARF